MILRVNFDQGVRANRKHMNIFQHLRTQMEEMGNSSSDMLLKKSETHYSMSKHQQTNNIGVVVTRDNLTWRETLSNTARPTVSSNDEVLWIVPPDYEETKAGRTSLRKKILVPKTVLPIEIILSIVEDENWNQNMVKWSRLFRPKNMEASGQTVRNNYQECSQWEKAFVFLPLQVQWKVDKCKMLRHLQ